MKDKFDTKTIDFVSAPKTGRPRKYRTNAERQRAYRLRIKLAQGG